LRKIHISGLKTVKPIKPGTNQNPMCGLGLEAFGDLHEREGKIVSVKKIHYLLS
jgi:hypothetical protein